MGASLCNSTTSSITGKSVRHLEWIRNSCYCIEVLPRGIRIPSWLRNSHCGERRSHQRLISAVGLFPAIWRLSLYWISTRLHLFNTNTERWHQLQNKLLWNDLLKAKPKRQPSLGSMPIFLIAWAPGAVIPQSSVVQSHLLVTYR